MFINTKKFKQIFVSVGLVSLALQGCKQATDPQKTTELAKPASTLAATKANVIVIMADDLGYNDLGFQGSKHIKTPNIDKLANEGMVFSDAHVTASVCSPSRAGFVTSRYQQRFGHEANVPPVGKGMDVTEFTSGQAFQLLGYQTYIVGKWHLGDMPEHYPTNRGFDEFWGLREGSRSYFYDETKNDKPGDFHAIEHNGEQVKFEGFLTDRMTDKAIDMVGSTDKPFYMFLSYTAPHGPLEATEADLAKADGDPYVALVQNMDDNIGRLMTYLEQSGKRENTMIWFLSDNGGTVKQASNYPLNGKKGIKFEGGQRIPMLLNWPGKIPANSRFDQLVSAMDILPTSLGLTEQKVDFPKPIDGVDLQPYFGAEDNNQVVRNTLYWRKLEGKAIRDGDWKLIKTEGLEPMLYNLAEDISERNNLSSKKPEKTATLLNKLEAWEEELMEPLWVEGAKWIEVRKKDYIRFRDAKGFVSIRETQNLIENK